MTSELGAKMKRETQKTVITIKTFQRTVVRSRVTSELTRSDDYPAEIESREEAGKLHKNQNETAPLPEGEGGQTGELLCRQKRPL